MCGGRLSCVAGEWSIPNRTEVNLDVIFYVLLTVHPCIIFFKRSQLGAHYYLVYVFHLSTCFGQLCAHQQENLLYLCDTGIFHSVWVAVWSADMKLHQHRCENLKSHIVSIH